MIKIMKLLKYILFLCVLALVLLKTSAVHAQVTLFTNMPDPSPIVNNVQTPFVNTVSFYIAASAVLILIGWLLKVMRRR